MTTLTLVDPQSMETLPRSGKVWYSWKGIVREVPMSTHAIRRLPGYKMSEDYRLLMAWSYTATFKEGV